MIKKIIFIGTPLILLVAAGLLYYQMFLQNDDISNILQQEFTVSPGDEPDFEEVVVTSPPTTMELPPSIPSEPVASDVPSIEESEKLAAPPSNGTPESTPESKTPQTVSSETTKAPDASEQKSAAPAEMAKVETPNPSKEKGTQKEGKPKKTKKVKVFLPNAALVETPESRWTVVKSNQSTPKTAIWQTIAVQNHLKFDYTVRPQGSSKWSYANDGKAINLQFAEDRSSDKDILSRKKQGKYAIQMMSVEEKKFALAHEMLQILIRDGYYAYIHRTDEKFKGSYWFRLRVGFFNTSEDAQAMGEEVFFRYRDLGKLPANYWAVIPTPQELNRKILDFRTEQNKPWVLELPRYSTQKSATLDFPKLAGVSDFAYLSYQQMPDRDPQFRIQLGFFETQAEAEQHRATLKRVKSSFGSARISKL